MKKLYLSVLMLISICLSVLSSLHASHYLGADITYECIDSCTYRIYHQGYFDCSGAFMAGGGYVPIDSAGTNAPPAPGFTFDFTGIPGFPGQLCVDPIPVTSWILESYEEVTQVCPGLATQCTDPGALYAGVVGAIYTREYDFCATNCPSYELEWEECCRNNVITSGAANDGIYLGGITIFPNDTVCNSSPIFTQKPTAVICLGSPTSLTQGGIDPEGDSLVYSLGPCLDGASLPVGYNAGYSPTSPLGPGWTVGIDALTGILTFVPGPSASLEVGVLCVQVDEYRNGALLGSVFRDIQVTVLPCTGGQSPVVGPLQVVNGGQLIGANVMSACPNNPLSFSVSISDADTNDVLTVIGSFTQALDSLDSTQVVITGVNPVSVEVTWTPTMADLNQTIPFTIGAYDETCPFALQSLGNFAIQVQGPCLGAQTTDTQCNDSTGMIDLTVIGGTPPYTYLWSTGETTEDIGNLTVGSYWVDVSDASGGLFLTDTFFINALDITLQPILTLPNCDGTGGEIEIIASGGTLPYTYDWSTGAQLSTISNLSPGGYSVTVTDAAGCPQHDVFFLPSPDTCFVSVSGTAFYDLNGNCMQDSNELGVPYLYIDLSPGGATFTDANGNYFVALDTGAIDLQTQPVAGSYLSPLCPTNGLHSLILTSYDADTSGVDFAMDVLPVQDLRIVGSFLGTTNPGFPYTYALYVHNDGNLPVNATVEFQLDNLMAYDSSSVMPQSYDPVAHQLTWQINPILPGQAELIKVYGLIDSSASITDSVLTTATVLPIMGDTTPANNVFVDHNPVVGSFDPNDKQVSPTGFGTAGFIQASENDMIYTVRFQNTGNFPAQFVVIRDTITHKLDLSSFRPVIQSHTYTLDVEEDSILVFRFDNINLPDSLSDPIGSQGMVRFSMKHEGTLALGDQIHNSAAIYFDFNTPIITNEVLNTIYAPMALDFLSDELLCEGDSIIGVLTDEGLAPFSYAWNTGTQSTNNTQTISPTAVATSGYYTLSVTDALGISVTDSVFLDVTQFPIAQTNTDIQGLQVQFTDASLHAESWFWEFGDGTTSTDASPTHVYTSVGGYVAQLIVSNSCGSDTISVSLPLINSTDDLFAQSVEVLPNPFSQQTVIRFSNPRQESFQMILMDVQGKEIRRYEGLQSEEILINRKDLGAGLYLFRLLGDSMSYTGKLLVE